MSKARIRRVRAERDQFLAELDKATSRINNLVYENRQLADRVDENGGLADRVYELEHQLGIARQEASDAEYTARRLQRELDDKEYELDRARDEARSARSERGYW